MSIYESYRSLIKPARILLRLELYRKILGEKRKTRVSSHSVVLHKDSISKRRILMKMVLGGIGLILFNAILSAVTCSAGSSLDQEKNQKGDPCQR